MDVGVAVVDLFQIVLLQQEQLRAQAAINHIESRLRDDPSSGRRGQTIRARRQEDKARAREHRRQFDACQLKIDDLLQRVGDMIKP